MQNVRVNKFNDLGIKMPENTGEIQVNGRFTKGKSGNPKGKPKGSKHKASLMAEMLFESLFHQQPSD